MIAAKNIEILRQRQPNLAQKIINHCSRPSRCGISVSSTQRGVPTVEVLIESEAGAGGNPKGNLFLHSRYDPISEAARLVDNYKMPDHTNLVVLGFGFGYHVEELLKRGNRRDIILVVEKNIDVFCAALKNRDFSELLSQPGVFFAVDEDPIDIFRMLRSSSLTIKANGISLAKHPPSTKLYSGYYDRVLKAVNDIFIWANVNLTAQINSGESYTKNIIQNIPRMIGLAGVRHLFGLFQQKPAIIVAAGPSLSKNIRLLRDARGKAVIIAVDTALRPLLKQGIRPDFTVSIDFTSHNQRYFDQIESESLCLVADCEIYPPILEGFQGKKFIINLPEKALSDWYLSIVGDEGSINKGLSVAHTAFELAVKMGCNPIIFVGQDLAFTGGISHAKDTSMARVEEVEATVWVPGAFGKPIQTSLSLQVFLKHLEELVQGRTREGRFQCIDSTEGGAMIEGTRPMPLEHALALYCRGDFDIDEAIEGAARGAGNIDNTDKLLAETERKIHQLERMRFCCSQACNLLQRIKERLLSQVDASKGKRTASKAQKRRLGILQGKFKVVSNEIRNSQEIIDFMKDNITRELVLQATKDDERLDRIDFESRTRLIPTAEKCIKIYGGIGNAATLLKKLMEELAADLAGSRAETYTS